MTNNFNNSTIREIDNDKGLANLTMDDVLNGTIDNAIDLLVRAGNSTDLDKLLFFIESPGLIGSEQYLHWALSADPNAVTTLQ